MAGLNLTQLKYNVIEPAITIIGMMSTAALNLVTGTAVQESGASYLLQVQGPALGLFQMEPATEQDIWTSYLAFQPVLMSKVKSLLMPGATTEQLVPNLAYAAAMCRIKYWRSPAPLPAYNDATGLANACKSIYNSSLGAGTVDAATIANFQAAISA